MDTFAIELTVARPSTLNALLDAAKLARSTIQLRKSNGMQITQADVIAFENLDKAIRQFESESE